MIDNYFTTEFTNYRQGGYVNGLSSRNVVGTFKGHLQQPSAELVENLGMSFTGSFIMWCALDTDVYVGDDLEDGDNNTYSIRSINKRNYAGNSKHLELFIERNEKYASV
jgi:hypothetical protein